MKKHLAKEGEQLQPLILQHFTYAEQAELVAQFIYCIPLAMVEKVLAWLKPSVPKVRVMLCWASNLFYHLEPHVRHPGDTPLMPMRARQFVCRRSRCSCCITSPPWCQTTFCYNC